MTVYVGLVIILGFALFGVACMWLQARHGRHKSEVAALLTDAREDPRSLAQMVSQITPQNAHAEVSVGSPRGREILPPKGGTELGAAGLRTFFRIMDAWEVDSERAMAILGTPRTIFRGWKQGPTKARLTLDQFERLSYVFGIYAALQILVSDSVIADAWVNRPNSSDTFGGRRPIEMMLSGEISDLRRVREYLEAQL